MNRAAYWLIALLALIVLLAQITVASALERILRPPQPDARTQGETAGKPATPPPPKTTPPANHTVEKSSSSKPANPKPTHASMKKGTAFASGKKAEDHFEKHGKEVGAKTRAEYEAKAISFANRPPSPELVDRLRPNGDRIRWDRKTDQFVAVKRDGTIKTYMSLDPDKHGYPSNQAYVDAQ